MPIWWHEEDLASQMHYLRGMEKELLLLQERVNHLRLETQWYESQIVEAKARGMDGFDSSRFMVKREATDAKQID